MGERPRGMTLDRINSDSDYGPGACRWATRKQQIENRRLNRPLRHDGRTMLITEWAEQTGVPQRIIFWRLRNGWTVKATLNTPRINRGPKPKPRN